MLAKRIIPCLDVDINRVVKGTEFRDLQDVGDPFKFAQKYQEEGADEISILDISASKDNREITLNTIRSVAKNLFIPLSVGGGIRSIKEIKKLLYSGVEKVAIGTSAVLNPNLIQSSADEFGSQAIVISLDVKYNVLFPSNWQIYIYGGTQPTEIDALNFALKMQDLGAGECLLNCIDQDGRKSGFNLQLNRLFSSSLSIPIIASGGAGSLNDFLQVFCSGEADAALAASVFHYEILTIRDVKKYLKKNNVEVRFDDYSEY